MFQCCNDYSDCLKLLHFFFNTVVSVSVSVSAERETFFRYRFRPKRKMAVSAIFGFGRNEKKPFGRTLIPGLMTIRSNSTEGIVTAVAHR